MRVIDLISIDFVIEDQVTAYCILREDQLLLSVWLENNDKCTFYTHLIDQHIWMFRRYRLGCATYCPSALQWLTYAQLGRFTHLSKVVLRRFTLFALLTVPCFTLRSISSSNCWCIPKTSASQLDSTRRTWLRVIAICIVHLLTNNHIACFMGLVLDYHESSQSLNDSLVFFFVESL